MRQHVNQAPCYLGQPYGRAPMLSMRPKAKPRRICEAQVADAEPEVQDHKAGALTLEGGYQFSKVRTALWLRGGWFRSTGANDTTDGRHNTFFEVPPTPRIYARLPFCNLMNPTDYFVQQIAKPVKGVAVRSDFHWLQLTSGGEHSRTKCWVTSAVHQTTRTVSPSRRHQRRLEDDNERRSDFYYAYAQDKTVVAAIYPFDCNLQYGYVGCEYHWSLVRKGTK